MGLGGGGGGLGESREGLRGGVRGTNVAPRLLWMYVEPKNGLATYTLVESAGWTYQH